MKSRMRAVLMLVGLSCSSAQAQGTFQNLDFEDAYPTVVPGSPYYPYGVTASSALPYWTVTLDNVQQTQITEDDPSLGAAWVSIVTPGYGAIDGNYSVLLQNGVPFQNGNGASISQTGLIPASAESLLFDGVGAGPLEVWIGSQVIPFTVVGTGVNYSVYGANISAWAGQTEQLTFSAPEAGGGDFGWHIDDISFSPGAIPEPRPFVLTGIGGLLFALYRRLGKKQR